MGSVLPDNMFSGGVVEFSVRLPYSVPQESSFQGGPMNQPGRHLCEQFRSLPAVISVLLLIPSCTPIVNRPPGPAGDYSDAVDFFGKSNLKRAIEFTDNLAAASPPNAFTDRARVLRVIVFSGQVRAFKELTDAYSKGLETTKDSRAKADFSGQRADNLQLGVQAALHLAEAAHALTQSGALPKDLVLEAPYPSAEGPTVVAQLTRVKEGGAISADDQQAAAVAAQRKGIDDALAEVVSGGRAEARSALKAGPVKLDDYKFAVFLANQALTGATLLNRKHMHDPEKFKILCGEADAAAKAALATLQDNPDKDKEKEIKKLQDDIKAALKVG
jgi:hypothetical protein